MKKKNLYLTGESVRAPLFISFVSSDSLAQYAGTYIPCTFYAACILCFSGTDAKVCVDIANYIYQHPKALDLNLQGMWISDRKRCVVTSISLISQT